MGWHVGLVKYFRGHAYAQIHTQTHRFALSCCTRQQRLVYQLRTSVCLSREESFDSTKRSIFALTAWQRAALSVCTIRDWRLQGFACRSLFTTLLPVSLSLGSHLICNASVLLQSGCQHHNVVDQIYYGRADYNSSSTRIINAELFIKDLALDRKKNLKYFQVGAAISKYWDREKKFVIEKMSVKTETLS